MLQDVNTNPTEHLMISRAIKTPTKRKRICEINVFFGIFFFFVLLPIFDS